MKAYYVYILASKRNGTLYKILQLVYYEIHNDILEAIKREKNIQVGKRNWKLQLIEKNNPDWDDLYDFII